MDIGLILSIAAAICFAAGTVSMRRGLFHTETAVGTIFVSVPIGAIYFAVLLIATAQYERLWHIPWHVFAVLAASGVINFIAGRLLSYTCVQLLGANRTGAIMRTAPLWAVVFGVGFLDESLTLLMILGILMLVFGATLASVRSEREARAVQVRGVIAGFGGALCYSLAAALIRAVIEEVGSPIAAAFVSFTVATIVVASLLLRKYFRDQVRQLERRSVVPFVIAGTLSATAQLFRYSALGYSPVSLVEPVMSTSVIFVLVFSFFINRQMEIFSTRVIAGILLAAGGASLMFL